MRRLRVHLRFFIRDYIMVHDYNNIVYNGTAQAVVEYCDKNGISYVPLADMAGSIVITK